MSAPTARDAGEEPWAVLPPELRPSVEHLVTEDDTPVDSIFSEKQMRLLTRALYSSWAGPVDDPRFIVLANVGLFFSDREPPVVPDVLLSLHVSVPGDLREKKHRSYFTWIYGKSPDAVVEIVSNDEGGELGPKQRLYARLGIPVYIVWDPYKFISTKPLQVFELHGRRYQPVAANWLETLGLGLSIWHGTFEQQEADWLRWCDRQGVLIPLGEERAEEERQRAEEERQRAAKAEERLGRLEAQLRQHGIEPNGSPPAGKPQ